MADKCFCHLNGYEVKDKYARERIELTRKQLFALGNDIGMVDTEHNKTQETVADHETRITNLEATSGGSGNSPEINYLMETVADHETRLKNQNTTLTNHQIELNEYETRITALESGSGGSSGGSGGSTIYGQLLSNIGADVMIITTYPEPVTIDWLDNYMFQKYINGFINQRQIIRMVRTDVAKLDIYYLDDAGTLTKTEIDTTNMTVNVQAI